VFALPGSVTNPLAETPLGLLREGATMIRGVADLLEDLGLDTARHERPTGPTGLSDHERRIFEQLTAPMLPAAVARAAGLTAGDALSALISLELRGLVRGLGGRFERTFQAVRGPASA
jgi:DNA processing protein